MLHLEQKSAECPFCSLSVKRVVAETQYFILIKPLFPIVNAEILIIPRRHTGSIALLNLFERNEVDEIWKIIFDSICDLRCGIVFEHGNHSHSPFEPWHKHAHLHILAVPIKIFPLFSHLIPIQHVKDYSLCEPFSSEYVFYKDIDSQPTFFILTEPLPRNFFKTRVQEQINQTLSQSQITNEAWLDAEKQFNFSIKNIPYILKKKYNQQK